MKGKMNIKRDFMLNKKKLNKVKRIIITLLFMLMLVLIYIVSPRITDSIQNGAKFIYEMDSSIITRVAELLLAISLSLSALFTKNDSKGE